VTIVRALKVGVKVGMVGSGVIVGGTGVSVGWVVKVEAGVKVSGVRGVEISAAVVSTMLNVAA
jgi:hypothetical protein